MELRRTTRPVTSKENSCCHHPSSLRDDKVLSLNHETPFHLRIQFRPCFLVVGECLQVWENGVLVWACGFCYWFMVFVSRELVGSVCGRMLFFVGVNGLCFLIFC